MPFEDSHDQRHQARKEATERAIRSSVLPVHTIALTIQFYRLCAGQSCSRCSTSIEGTVHVIRGHTAILPGSWWCLVAPHIPAGASLTGKHLQVRARRHLLDQGVKLCRLSTVPLSLPALL